MDHDPWTVRRIALPPQSRATRFYATTDLADAYAVTLPHDAIDSTEQLARFVLSHQPAWIAGLTHVRDALVGGFGLKTTTELRTAPDTEANERIEFFRIYERHPHELLLGEDDKHLDFRLSVLQQTTESSGGGQRQLVISTVVHCHNLAGRAYIAVIAPFHRLVVRASLRNAAQVGWPLRHTA